MDNTITVKGHKQSYTFGVTEIKDLFWCDVSDEGVMELASVLAANVEGDFQEDEIVPLLRTNFNDCFGDIVEDLQEQIDYGHIK